MARYSCSTNSRRIISCENVICENDTLLSARTYIASENPYGPPITNMILPAPADAMRLSTYAAKSRDVISLPRSSRSTT